MQFTKLEKAMETLDHKIDDLSQILSGQEMKDNYLFLIYDVLSEINREIIDLRFDIDCLKVKCLKQNE